GGVEIREHLVHAAVLRVERALLLFLADAVDTKRHPISHPGDDLARVGVAAQLGYVEQAGHDLVNGVIRRPDLLAAFDAVEELVRERREIPRMKALRLSV